MLPMAEAVPCTLKINIFWMVSWDAVALMTYKFWLIYSSVSNFKGRELTIFQPAQD